MGRLAIPERFEYEYRPPRRTKYEYDYEKMQEKNIGPSCTIGRDSYALSYLLAFGFAPDRLIAKAFEGLDQIEHLLL